VTIVNGIASFTPPSTPVALTLGFFDGVHRGHQQLLATLTAAARTQQATPVVLTFDSHPYRIVCPDKLPPMIMTLTQRIALFEQMGIAHVIVQPFDQQFSEIPARAFVHDLLVRKIQARIIVCGYDTHFGRAREGTHALLREMAAAEGYLCDDVPPLRADAAIVSSTAIRKAIQGGDLATAHALLGRPWSIWAHVVEGLGVGRQLGYPTANLDTGYLVVPASGIYAAYVHLHRATYRGVLYVGTRPTVTPSVTARTCEVYVMDFSGDLYEEWILVEPVQHLRDDQLFTTLDELRTQISRDVQQAKSLLKTDYVSPAVLPRHYDEVDRRHRARAR
jgi:riboflavin kinase/FMN adenylyltransferase